MVVTQEEVWVFLYKGIQFVASGCADSLVFSRFPLSVTSVEVSCDYMLACCRLEPQGFVVVFVVYIYVVY